jgi:hypothetical protein
MYIESSSRDVLCRFTIRSMFFGRGKTKIEELKSKLKTSNLKFEQIG